MKNLFKHTFLFLFAALAIVSCSDDDAPELPQIGIKSEGILVLNEGNYYNKINGTLSYIDFDNGHSITNGVFQAVNHRSLGGTPNAVVEHPLTGKIFIACTDENRVEVISQGTFASVATITVTSPREMAVSDNRLFVTSYDGTVSMYNVYDYALMGRSAAVGDHLEGIAVRGGYLYVSNSCTADYTYHTNVIKMDMNLSKVSDITVACNPTDIKAEGDAPVVLSMGNYGDVKPQIQEITTDDRVVKICDATLFDIAGGNVYAIYQDPMDSSKPVNKITVYRKDGAHADLQMPVEFENPCGLLVNPVSGDMYISSRVMGEYGYPDYSAPGYVTYLSATMSNYKRMEAGVGPCCMVFDRTIYTSGK